MPGYTKNINIDIEFDERGMHVWYERVLRFVSWDRLGVNRHTLEQAFLDDEYCYLSESLRRRLVDAGVLLSEDCPDPEFLEENRQYGYFASISPGPTRSIINIRESTVLILGIGGTGAGVLQHLVGSGVRKFILVDCDVVEPSNLNRQYAWDREDLGEPKVNVAKKYIMNRNPEACVQTHACRIESVADLHEILRNCDPDFVIVAIDQPQGIQNLAQSCCSDVGIASIGGAVGVQSGHWGPLISPVQGPDWNAWIEYLRSVGSYRSSPIGPSSRPITKWSFGPTNALIAAYMAMDVLQYLSGAENVQTIGALKTVDFSTLEISSISYQDNSGELT